MSYVIYNKQDNSVAIITSIEEESISSFYANFVRSIGGDESHYGMLQTNDHKVHTNKITVRDGSIIIGASLGPFEQLTPSEAEELRAQNEVLQLALAESIEKQEIDKVNNQIALAELVETLIIKGVL